MRPLLSRENSEVLAQFAFSNVLLAFDFDGTLAPIVERPEEACMRPSTAALFSEVTRLYPSVVISGRAKDDVSARLGGASLRHVVGNHGLEAGQCPERFVAEMEEVRKSLASRLRTSSGIEIEDKRYSLAIHYRRARNKGAARALITRAVGELPSKLRLVPGKQVVNLVPMAAPNKGDALLLLRAQERCDTAVYVGDDVTDEDVFKLDQPGRLLSVRVGQSLASEARYFLRDQRDVDRFLRRLVDLRQPEEEL